MKKPWYIGAEPYYPFAYEKCANCGSDIPVINLGKSQMFCENPNCYKEYFEYLKTIPRSPLDET